MPGHQDSNPSFSFNEQSGGFVCFGCGIKGGDIVAFVQLRDNVPFKVAAKQLGAWAEDEDTPAARKRSCEAWQQRQQLRAETEARVTVARELRIKLRTEIHCYERLLRDCGTYLTGSAVEIWWEVLASLQTQLRSAIAGYTVVAFGSRRERETYVQDLDRRTEIENQVLMRGFVIDDDGHRSEVVA